MPRVARGTSACPRERESRGNFWGGSHKDVILLGLALKTTIGCMFENDFES